MAHPNTFLFLVAIDERGASGHARIGRRGGALSNEMVSNLWSQTICSTAYLISLCCPRILYLGDQNVSGTKIGKLVHHIRDLIPLHLRKGLGSVTLFDVQEASGMKQDLVYPRIEASGRLHKGGIRTMA